MKKLFYIDILFFYIRKKNYEWKANHTMYNMMVYQYLVLSSCYKYI